MSQKRCYGPPRAEARSYDGQGSLDRLGGFLLEATNPRQDTSRGAHGFQIDEARDLADLLRDAWASGELTAADFARSDRSREA